MMDKEMQEIEVWTNLRNDLNNSYDFKNETWGKAIKLFKTRLNRKFFNPLEKIIKENELKGEGFTIVTVQCALIESLASFKEGKIYNNSWNTKSPKYEYGSSGKMFIEFLYTDKIFENHFYSKDLSGAIVKDDPFPATDFYKSVRCGLLHEARTKGVWKINASRRNVEKDTIFLERAGNKIEVLRNVLHFRLKECVTNYLEELKKQDNTGNKLRRYFGRKLDHLFDIPPDPVNYDWWQDETH